MESTLKDLSTLFGEARKRSEFDFVLILINYRGMGTYKLTSNLYEWFDAVEFYKKLFYSLSGKEKSRMAALLYSTFFENSDFYNIIGSLCKVKMGFKGSSYLFWKTRKYERLLGIGEKQDVLLELLYDANKQNIIRFFMENHFQGIRNTFFHSDYALSDEEYIFQDAEPIYIEGVGKSSFDIQKFFYPKVENVIMFFDAFKHLYLDSFADYKRDKEVIGMFPNPCKITILGSEDGLKGFRIKNSVKFYDQWHDSGIWYDEQYDMFAGHNIRLNFANVEILEINDQLRRYEEKSDIHQSDVEFHNMVEKIMDRRNNGEIARATVLLLKFGNLRYEKMLKEENPFKRRGYPKFILPFFNKAVEIGSSFFDTSEIKKLIVKLEKELSNT
jgi:hypothetical protein